MLIREGEQRALGIDIRLAALFAAIAGSLNAAGFQSTGFFSANMTGNVSALSDHLGQGQLGPAALFGTLIAIFISGAFVSGALIETGRKRGVRAIYAYSIVLEAILLILLGAAGMLVPGVRTGQALVLGLSFIMGLQNAATTRISNARVRTTHISGMATDIGLGVAALFFPSPNRSDAIARLKLHLCTTFSFLAGGIAGVALYLRIGGLLLILCAAVLLTLSLPEARRASRMYSDPEAAIVVGYQ